jgi:tetratricopeptide (TPR) repeat protein
MDHGLLVIIGVAAVLMIAVAWGTGRQPDIQARRRIARAGVAHARGDDDVARALLAQAHEFIARVRDVSLQNELYYRAEGLLGAIALDDDDFGTAERHLTAAHTRCETLLSPRDPETIGSVAHLAIACFELGRDDEANQWFERLLHYAPNEYRPETRTAVDLLRQTGARCTAHYIHRWSVPLLERALELNSGLVEEDANPRGPQILQERRQQVLRALALAHLVTADWAAARRRIDELTAAGVPEDDPDVEAWNGYLALMACDWDAATACFLHSLESVRTNFGELSPHYADALVRVADLHRSRAQFGNARQTAEQVLKVREQCLGPDDFVIAADMLRLGMICRQHGDLPSAEAHRDRSLGLAQTSRRRANPTLGTLHLIRGFLELDRERYAEAEQTLAQARRIATEIYGAGHRMTLDSIMGLAVATSELGRLDEAIELIKEAQSISERHAQTAVLDTVDLHLSTAHVALARGTLSEVEQSLQAATALVERHVGRRHYACAETLHLLGRLQLRQNRPAEAEQHLREALAIEEQLRLPEHPVIARICTDLADVLTIQRGTAEAAPFRNRAAAIRANISSHNGHG